MIDLEGRIKMLEARSGATYYGTETAAATDVNGVTWKTLFSGANLLYYTEIWGLTLTHGGAWAGTPKIRIVDGTGTTKLFPFAVEAVEVTDWTDTVPWLFPHPVCVPINTGYILQFRSTNAADGAGETLALTELAKIERRYM